MIEWLDDFYGDPDMRSTMLRNFLPLFTSYVTEATGGPVAAGFVQALAENYVDRHLGSSRAQLQEVVKGADDPLAALTARFDEWEEKRPEKVARNELVRSANAASVEKMREAGVTKMVWRASGGKTCPFCTELDGTIISVTGTFFEAGDTLNPEGATAPINFESSLGHPPVHQGCVCSVEAVMETEIEGIEERIAQAESEIAGSDTETLLIYDDNGNVIRRVTSGQEHGVSVTDEERALASGHITSHNHPTDSAQSLQDFRTLLDNQELESRVVTEDFVYRLRIDGEPTIAWNDPALTSAYERWQREAIEFDTNRAAEAWGEWRQYVDALPEGSPKGRGANPSLFDEISARVRAPGEGIQHRVWSQAQEEIPWLVYERSPRT